MYQLGVVRNAEAHINVSLWKDENTEQVNHAIAELEKIFEETDCDYLLPYKVKGDYCHCWMVRPGGTYPVTSVQIPRVQIPVDENQVGNQSLLYRTVDRRSGEIAIYHLTPFIRLHVNGSTPKFWMYLYTKNNGFGTGLHRICYESVMANDSNQFDTTDTDVSLSSLFPPKIISEVSAASKWVPSPYNQTQINISQYPGFGEIRKGGIPFCSEICVIRGKIKSFCDDDARQVCVIYGNGGLGKTALALSIISEYFSSTDENRYDYLIFLSAKDSYFSFDASKGGPFHRDDYAEHTDIRSYPEFISKLCALLELEYDASKLEDSAQAVYEGIVSSQKRFLLIIDDLDSISLENQKSVEELIYRFPAASLKTIVTTRKESGSSPVSFEMARLDERQSCAFAKWYCLQSGINWDGWQHRDEAIIRAISCFGEGNPLQIKMIVTLVSNGLQMNFYDIPATQRERAVYFYKTVHNILPQDQKIVFELCRRVYNSLPEEYREREIRKDIARYLSAGVGIDREHFESAWAMLIKLMLIRESRNQLFFQLYNAFVLDLKIVQISNLPIPKMYEKMMEHIKNNPELWTRGVDVEETLVACISSLEGDRDYDTGLVMKIYEEIDERTGNTGVNAAVARWMEAHSIDNPLEQAARMTEQLEAKLAAYEEAMKKDIYEEAMTALGAFTEAIQNAERYARENPNDELSATIQRLRSEACRIEENYNA